MKYEIIPAFAVPVGVAHLSKRFCDPLKELAGIRRGEPLIYDQVDKIPELKKELIKVFSDYINQHILGTPEQEYTITTSWVTENSDGDQMIRHHHRNSYYSSVFYFDKVTQEHTPLILENPLERCGFYVEPKVHNVFSGSDFFAPMAEGTIIFFPSYIFHFHHPFMFNKIPRKSLACNYIPIGHYGEFDSSLDTRKIHG